MVMKETATCPSSRFFRCTFHASFSSSYLCCSITVNLSCLSNMFWSLCSLEFFVSSLFISWRFAACYSVSLLLLYLEAPLSLLLVAEPFIKFINTTLPSGFSITFCSIRPFSSFSLLRLCLEASLSLSLSSCFTSSFSFCRFCLMRFLFYRILSIYITKCS